MKSYEQIVGKLKEKDEELSKKDNQIKNMQEEIDRRKYLDKKVQTYVRCLCEQNEKCKQFIIDNFEDEDGEIQEFLDSLQLDMDNG